MSMSKAVWGPTTWLLLHTLSYKLKDSEQHHAHELWLRLAGLCSILPCPDCRVHAEEYIRRSRLRPRTRQELCIYFWHMHNMVNVRLGAGQMGSAQFLQRYANANTDGVLRHFALVMSRNARSERAMLDAFTRKRTIDSFCRYITERRHWFNN